MRWNFSPCQIDLIGVKFSNKWWNFKSRLGVKPTASCLPGCSSPILPRPGAKLPRKIIQYFPSPFVSPLLVQTMGFCTPEWIEEFLVSFFSEVKNSSALVPTIVCYYTRIIITRGRCSCVAKSEPCSISEKFSAWSFLRIEKIQTSRPWHVFDRTEISVV